MIVNDLVVEVWGVVLVGLAAAAVFDLEFLQLFQQFVVVDVVVCEELVYEALERGVVGLQELFVVGGFEDALCVLGEDRRLCMPLVLRLRRVIQVDFFVGFLQLNDCEDCVLCYFFVKFVLVDCVER